ncbi:hypothetical protein PCANC_20402 [Puccinia coronata f. sp. avenae]|uniref:Uncharacterized protein n=1 Tax=Puccinia coronata f. sp. avenae TaxID=200324 RepID=A0A2N5SN14_9BASI|nr:hypothetical protein PCANC_20402 [Puccinia coronata f. sp. avenae]
MRMLLGASPSFGGRRFAPSQALRFEGLVVKLDPCLGGAGTPARTLPINQQLSNAARNLDNQYRSHPVDDRYVMLVIQWMTGILVWVIQWMTGISVTSTGIGWPT